MDPIINQPDEEFHCTFPLKARQEEAEQKEEAGQTPCLSLHESSISSLENSKDWIPRQEQEKIAKLEQKIKILEEALAKYIPRQEQEQIAKLEQKIKDLEEASAKDNKEWKKKMTRMAICLYKMKQQLDGDNSQVLDNENDNTIMKELEEGLESLTKRKVELEDKLQLRQEEMTEIIRKNEKLKEKVKSLRQSLENGGDRSGSRGTIDYRSGLRPSDPHSLIRPLGSNGEETEVTGLAILDMELFIVNRNSSTIQVWKLEPLCFGRRWMQDQLKNPTDMKQCQANKCLYLVNETVAIDGRGCPVKRAEIMRVSSTGQTIKSWTIDDLIGNISIAEDGNVLLVATKTNELREYSNTGNLLCTVPLPWTSGFDNLTHALKLTSGKFLVSHGGGSDALHRVCIVDTSGNVLKCHGKEWNREELNCPVYMERDSGGNVIVADGMNGRILVLDSNLDFVSVLITSSTVRCNSEESVNLSYRPRKICLNESHSRLFVAEDVYRKGENQDNDTMCKRLLSSFALSSSGSS